MNVKDIYASLNLQTDKRIKGEENIASTFNIYNENLQAGYNSQQTSANALRDRKGMAAVFLRFQTARVPMHATSGRIWILVATRNPAAKAAVSKHRVETVEAIENAPMQAKRRAKRKGVTSAYVKI